MNRTTEMRRLASSLRSYLRSLSSKRNSRTVTADDAQNYLTTRGVRTQMVRTRLSIINSVLRRTDFRPVGKTASRREPARYRQITEWRAR